MFKNTLITSETFYAGGKGFINPSYMGSRDFDKPGDKIYIHVYIHV